MSRPRKVTTSVVAALMSMAIELPPPSPRMPAVPTSQATVIALVMVRVPKPPESAQLISPPALVTAMAAAKVLQGRYFPPVIGRGRRQNGSTRAAPDRGAERRAGDAIGAASPPRIGQGEELSGSGAVDHDRPRRDQAIHRLGPGRSRHFLQEEP